MITTNILRYASLDYYTMKSIKENAESGSIIILDGNSAWFFDGLGLQPFKEN